jgi:two-component system, OmpR family, response regulator
VAAARDNPRPLILAAHPGRETVALLKSLLERDGYTVMLAYDGRAALASARRHAPALVLAAEELPFVSGLDLCRVLREELPNLALILLAAKREPLGTFMAFAAGADDWLALPFHPRELLARVRAVLRRTLASERRGHGHVECGELELDDEQRELRARGDVVPLTSLEYELAAQFIRHPDRVFTREELLARLRGFLRGEPLDRAVDVHVSHLRRKLARILGGAVPIETVRGVGYRLRSRSPRVATARRQPGANAAIEQVALSALRWTPIPLLVLAADRTVLLYNEAARALCGWGPEEISGYVKCYSLLGCHSRDGMLLCSQHCALHAAALDPTEEFCTRYVITTKDGREVPVIGRYTRLAHAPETGECTLLALQPDPLPAAATPEL